MRRIVLLLLSTAVGLLLASGAVLALPSERPDQTPMVNGTVRAIEQVGTNIWVGGQFTQVKQQNGTVVANVSNLAVFNSQTNQYENINLPKVDFGHLWTEGVGYARHRNRQKEVIDAHPTNHDDTGPSSLRATVFQTRLPACSTVANRFDPCPRQENRSLRP